MGNVRYSFSDISKDATNQWTDVANGYTVVDPQEYLSENLWGNWLTIYHNVFILTLSKFQLDITVSRGTEDFLKIAMLFLR